MISSPDKKEHKIKATHLLKWQDLIIPNKSYSAHNEFSFLNISKQFENRIDWNYSEFGKLWTYNLNYFDFLQQSECTKDIGLHLMQDYIKSYTLLKDGLEPYPTSLRIINWVKFVSKNELTDPEISKFMHTDIKRLMSRLEYHLLANHLLENAFAILFSAYYFKDEKLYGTAKNILEEQLAEQILKDGGHFELSPMYHQIILNRLLDCIHLIQNNKWIVDDLLRLLTKKASIMLGWLAEITFENQQIPLLNDSAYGIAPTTKELASYAEGLGVAQSPIKLSESGYRKYRSEEFELLMDVGAIGPSYQPGHAHADTLTFVLHTKAKPFIVDSGTSTYESSPERHYERSTSAHNTVSVNAKNSSEVWQAFRVADRAEIIGLEQGQNFIMASHSGYQKQGCVHQRKWIFDKDELTISDQLIGKNIRGKSYLHLHPDIATVNLQNDRLVTKHGTIIFKNALKIEVKTFMYGPEFNKRVKSQMIEIEFIESLITKFTFSQN